MATLLVAVVGATFAYFTATVGTGQISGNSTNLTTKVTDDTTFTFNGSEITHKYLDYPGGMAIIGAHASFKKDSSNDSTPYTANFNLQIKYTNETGTSLAWALFMKEGSELQTNLDPKCKLLVDNVGTTMRYWYGNDGESSTFSENQYCTLSDTDISDLETNSTTPIAYGYLPSTSDDGEQTISASDKATEGVLEKYGASGLKEFLENVDENGTTKIYYPKSEVQEYPLKGRSLNTDDVSDKYYYLVVFYPNKDSDQTTTDEAKSVQVSLEIDESSITTSTKNSD